MVAIIPQVHLKEIKTAYKNQIVADNLYGTTYSFSLNRNNPILKYNLTFVEGTLSGGTSPAWNISAQNPAITHIRKKVRFSRSRHSQVINITI